MPAKFSIRVLLVGLICLIGCGTSPPPAEDSWSVDSTIPVELPSLERQEPVTRDRLSALQARALRTLERETPDRDKVSAAYGELGTHLAAVGFYAAAADAFENARRSDPSAFRWPYLLGVSRQDDFRLEEAVEAYEEALKVGAPDGRRELALRLHRIDANLQLDRLDAAEADLEAVSGSDRAGAAYLFAAARVAAARNRHQEAVDYFEQVLDLDPAASAVRYPLSQSYRQVGDAESAAYHAARRGDRRPSFADPEAEEVGRLVSLTALEAVRSRAAAADFDPVADLGFTLANLSSVGGAAEQLEQVLVGDAKPNRDVEEARLRYLLGGLWVARGDDARAEPHFRRAVQAEPELAAAWIKLGNVAARSGRFQDALDIYSNALEQGSGRDVAEAHLKRAAAWSALGRPGEAERELRQARRSPAFDPTDDPDLSARVVAALASTLDAQGRVDEARRLLGEQLAGPAAEKPENARLHAAAADGLRRAQRFDAALKAYEQALGSAPDLREAGLGRAAVLGHLGRLDEAATAYGDLLTRFPSLEAARRGEITALLLTERYREAIRSLRHAIEIDESDGLEWRHALARLRAACPDAELRRPREALELAEAVFDRRPSLRHGDTLAMAYAASGDYAQAVVIQRNLIGELRAAGRNDMIPELTRRLSLYEQGRPFVAADPHILIVTAPAGGGA